MLPIELHIEQVEKLHYAIKTLGTRINKTTDEKLSGELSIVYFNLANLWMKLLVIYMI